MRLKKLVLNNVRSYDTLRLDFDGDFLYFFGLNGSGKTTIGRALLFLVGVEPESGDIRNGADALEVVGGFSPEGVGVPWPLDDDGLFWIKVEKERGKSARYFYKKGEQWVKTSKVRVYSFFSDVGASPSQVFLQMGAIPLPFRSASEEHIKKRGIREHRRRRFDALVDLLGLRRYVERLVDKEEELEEVGYKFREVSAKLEEAQMRFDSLRRKKQLWDEYQRLSGEKKILEKEIRLSEVASVLTQMRDVARRLGEVCSKLRSVEAELQEVATIRDELVDRLGVLRRELSEVKKREENYLKRREELSSKIYALKDKLQQIGDVSLTEEEWQQVASIGMDVSSVDREIKSLSREISATSKRLASVQASREAMEKLLAERKAELVSLLSERPDRPDDTQLEELLRDIELLRSRLRSLKRRYEKYQKVLKRARVLVKDPAVAQIVSKVLAIWSDGGKYLDVVSSQPDVSGSSLFDFVSQVEDESLEKLLKRIIIADSEEGRDLIRSKGAAAVWNGEIWEWWGKYLIEGGVEGVGIVPDESLDAMEAEIAKVESEIAERTKVLSALKRQVEHYKAWESKKRYIEEDIKAIEKKLSGMEDEGELRARLNALEARYAELERLRDILKRAALVRERMDLEKKLVRLEDELARLRRPDVDGLRKEIEGLSAELVEIKSRYRGLEEERRRLVAERDSLRKQLLSLKMSLAGVDGSLLREAVLWKGDDVASLKGRLMAVSASLASLGQLEDVSEVFREAEEVLQRMKIHYEEVERWKERAERDFYALKEGLNRSLKDIAASVSKKFSDFLKRFGFDGKVTISVTSELPFKGEVKVSIMAGDGDWVDYDAVRLSGGEGILIAFSLYLAFWLEKVGDIHMLVVDEAQTNLDDVNFERLMELLMNDVSGQIYVMTMVEPPLKVAENPNARIYHVYRNPVTGASEVVAVG